ncbi:hypothetical protein AB0O76_07030 [Streptomyces sp. NPDC086554]|uniref:hypothetical protein n=1 Tax=Streptomyces sp. NPDC086554 TaxID=3154864 RepID=UPI00343BC084
MYWRDIIPCADQKQTESGCLPGPRIIGDFNSTYEWAEGAVPCCAADRIAVKVMIQWMWIFSLTSSDACQQLTDGIGRACRWGTTVPCRDFGTEDQILAVRKGTIDVAPERPSGMINSGRKLFDQWPDMGGGSAAKRQLVAKIPGQSQRVDSNGDHEKTR